MTPIYVFFRSCAGNKVTISIKMCVHQNGSIKSDNIKATYNGTKWTTEKTVNYSPSYQYYAYYPYTTSGLSHLGTSSAKGSITASATSAASGTQAANGARTAAATRTVSANTSASDFFATGISAFTPAADQSTTTNFNASDLQVAKATISRVDASDVNFSLERQMGLAEMTVSSSMTRNVPTTITYDGNTEAESSRSTGTTQITITPSSSFSGNIPYSTGTGNLYAAIVKPSTNTTFSTTQSGTLDRWSYTFNIATGNTAAMNFDNAIMDRTAYTMIWNYEYKGSVATFTAPIKGTYKLEVWGAQGVPGNLAGKGGYSYGNINREYHSSLYLCVGGQSSYNGGGAAMSGGTGGGATHISTTNRGVLSNYANYQGEILLVAGGGGGTENTPTGGSGGGGNNNGGDGTRSGNSWRGYGTGGTQTAGGYGVIISQATSAGIPYRGEFGKGGGSSTSDMSGGGGGGWYGGGGFGDNFAPAGGGSGHIGSGFIDGTTGGENGVRAGNGYARITFVP